ncbi:MAG: nuclear transport factor 2 family protein [Solirubrobacterales bacterium]
MSEENVEIVRRMYGVFHAGDAEASLAHFDPGVTVDASRRMDGAVGRGHDFLNTVISQWIGTFEGWHEEIEEIRDFGAKVYVVATQHGRGKGSVEVEQRYALVYEVEEARIVRMTIYLDETEALEAAGLRE